MDEVRNPFAPGAGTTPPELAGRADLLSAADVALQRLLRGRSARGLILTGLRGTGKTVLLNALERRASELNYETAFIEAPEGTSLQAMLYPKIGQALRRFSTVEQARTVAHQAMKTLRSFASVFNLEAGGVTLSVDPEPGSADSGNLELDLTDVLLRLGEAAKAAGRGWALCLDEIQYLQEPELAALIVALHRTTQRDLPVILFGAGLPQLAGISGDAKSYAERLFDFRGIGPLSPEESRTAIAEPIVDEGETIEDDALEKITVLTQGYAYFLQEWGYQCWNIADVSPITAQDVDAATPRALARLDDSFFRVRFDRLTPSERDYVRAMATLGDGPYRSGDVADVLGRTVGSLAPTRSSVIKKGMIYSPAHGDVDFTVPMFAQYLKRSALT